MGKRFLVVRNALTGGVRKVRLPDRVEPVRAQEIDVRLKAEIPAFTTAMTRVVLVGHAEGLGIEVPKRATKAEIVELLAEAGEGDGADLG